MNTPPLVLPSIDRQQASAKYLNCPLLDPFENKLDVKKHVNVYSRILSSSKSLETISSARALENKIHHRLGVSHKKRVNTR